MLHAKSKKTTLNQLQKLCGFLNFLGRCIIPGTAFTRRLYAYTQGNLKPHHHIRITQEMRLDLTLWRTFLNHQSPFCRPFIDFQQDLDAETIYCYTDASGRIGMGGVRENSWMIYTWDQEFLDKYRPQIQCLELYALVSAIVQWIGRYRNRHVILFCDNKNVESAASKSSTSCPHCMKMIRILVLHCLKINVMVKVNYIRSKENKLADALSRGKVDEFFQEAAKVGRVMEPSPTPVPSIMTPMHIFWN